VFGLLRRLLSGAPQKSQSAAGGSQRPWYLRDQSELTPERIEEARQRLKKTIPPPEPDEPETAP